MTTDQLIEAFKVLSKEDVLADMGLDRDPVYQLTKLCNFLALVEDWIAKAKTALAITPQPELQGAIDSASSLVNINLPRAKRCLANAEKAQDKGTTVPKLGELETLSRDNDPALNCIERQQEINRETWTSLSEADNVGERFDAIREWGQDTGENMKDCLDGAFGQFDKSP